MRTLFIAAFLLLALSCKKNNPQPDLPPQPVTSVGAFYEGGIVFSLDSDGQHGYIVTANDLDTCNWSNTNTSIFPNSNNYYNQYGLSPTDVGAGKINTDLIVNDQGNGQYAAKLCKDLVLNGYDDWFLPSREEIILIKNSQVFPASPYNSTNPAYGFYWTSNESSQNTAIGMRLYYWQAQGNGQLDLNKTTASSVKLRAIRKF